MHSIAPNIWIAEQPLRFLGLHLGTRMTLVRLADGGLFVHSPIALTPSVRQAIEELGAVQHVVAPNLYHHRFVGEYRDAFPNARVYGAAGLAQKRKDVAFDATLGASPEPGWERDLDQHFVEGCALRETVFFHRSTGTLITSDFIENFESSPHFATRMYLRAGGIENRPGLSRLLRPLFRDRRAARASVDRILQWEVRRIILAHGKPIEHRPRETIDETYRWLNA
jgi:hypothetical protein